MASEFSIQTLVHKLEEGGWVKWVRLALLLAVLSFVFYRFLFTDGSPGSFRGLSHSKGMDQAQIAREIARGNGFSTKVIRPIAIRQFMVNKGAFPSGNIPDTYHAPLNPFVNSFFLKIWKGEWPMTTKDIVYTCDRVIAGVSMLFFLLSVAVNYFTACRLFDRRLAMLGMGLVLLSDTFWQFSMTGLPQMLMLFLFSGCAYALARAVELNEWRIEMENPPLPGADALLQSPEEPQIPFSRPGFALFRVTYFWLVVASLFFGLLALAHGLTIWIFAGALVFCGVYFRERTGTIPMRLLKNPALVMLAAFTLVYGPWMVRNQRVCGSPFGIAPYTALYQVRGTESQIMRDQSLSLTGVNPLTYRLKAMGQIAEQIKRLYGYLGAILVAPLFFLTLLHPFKGRQTSAFRWCLLLMWISALVGMGVFGLEGSSLDANDLHILFAPLMTFYGLSLVLIMWSRLEIHVTLVRYGFLGLLFILTGMPLFNTLFGKVEGRINWPPYVPPFISILGEWVRDNELICSDMPWGVAWYADRRSLWLPTTVKEFIDLNDHDDLHGRLVGLYLTPVTGDKPFISDIVKGEYKDWYPFIIRNVQVRDFPLRAVTALPIDNECVFYCDRDRWSTRTD